MRTRQQLIEFLGSAPRRVHLVGIGGSGMSGLARLLLQQGHSVSGCDILLNGETGQLSQLGARIFDGHSPRHIEPDIDLVVHTSAVNGENDELQAAGELQIPVVRRGLLLAALMTGRDNIAVAGTHGKTTTTAMIAHVLARSGNEPSYCVGAHVPMLGANAQCGAGDYFVAEADESDGTLIGFTPEFSVCLNIEPEHMDHYGSMDQMRATFASFFASTLKTVFYCVDCQNCTALVQNNRSAISFGLAPTADYRALDIQPTTWGSRFDIACRTQPIGTVELRIPGAQNVVNALATVAVVDQLGVPFEQIADALAEFTGAKRRFERKYDGDGIVVVDDYAHHPTEIRATIAAARTLGGFKRIIAAFQPHRYTRTAALREEFATAFAGVDRLYLTDIYAASEKPIEGVTGQTIVKTVTEAPARPNEIIYEPNLTTLAGRMYRDAERGDLILTMGAGDIYKVAGAVAEKLSPCGPSVVRPAQLALGLEEDLRGLLSPPSQLRRDEPMARHTSWKIGGPAELWAEPWDEQDLARLLQYCHLRGVPLTIVGRGSNLLVRDGGIAGVVVHLCSPEFSKIEVDGERLHVRAGARLRGIVNKARAHELGGLEFLEGIPGSLGGALRMNAGAMGRQTFEVVERVRYVSLAGEIREADARALPVTYRSCPLLNDHVALAAVLRGERALQATIDTRLRAFGKKRWSSQPARPSAGCVFKNPETVPAGRLIEELELKGTTVGNARVSQEHGNFIVNDGGATAAEVLALIAMIRDRARRERGIELETEVMILGKEATRS